MATALTRLELAKRLAQRSGTIDQSAVTSTTSPPTDQVEDLVAFIDQAWMEIQLSKQSRWKWMRNQLNYTKALTASNRSLAMSTIDSTCQAVIPHVATDMDPLRYIQLKHPTSDAIHRAVYIPYPDWRGYRDRGDRPEGRPVRFTVLPDGSLEFDPTPDVAYKLDLDWQEEPQEFAADADTPGMPADYHMLIVWWAMIEQMGYDENQLRYQTANRRMRILYERLCINQLDESRHTALLFSDPIYSW